MSSETPTARARSRCNSDDPGDATTTLVVCLFRESTDLRAVPRTSPAGHQLDNTAWLIDVLSGPTDPGDNLSGHVFDDSGERCSPSGAMTLQLGVLFLPPSKIDAGDPAAGPGLAEHGVVRFRLYDLCAWVEKRFSVTYHEQGLSRLIKRLGFRRISARPQHPKSDPESQAAFKKTSVTWCQEPPLAQAIETVTVMRIISQKKYRLIG